MECGGVRAVWGQFKSSGESWKSNEWVKKTPSKSSRAVVSLQLILLSYFRDKDSLTLHGERWSTMVGVTSESQHDLDGSESVTICEYRCRHN